MHCEKWHKKEECDTHNWPDGYDNHHPNELKARPAGIIHSRPEFCKSCAPIHHPPCCDYCCA